MIQSRTIATASLCLALALPAAAQTSPQPAFDVASVKPNKTTDESSWNFPLGPGDAYTPNGGYFRATNLPLSTYIGFAYRIMGDQAQSLLDQLPAWVREERFDIQARSSAEIKGPLPPGAEAPMDRLGPTFEEALSKQLGLKLVSQKTTVAVLILDHVERPTEN